MALVALTPRQLECLTLLAEGLDYRGIADRLIIAKDTVHRHIYKLYENLDVPNAAAAVSRGYQLGLLGNGNGETAWTGVGWSGWG